MTKIAQLSVAIATLDRPEALARCLDALLAGAVLPAEVIVIDQSRNNATKAVVERRQLGPVPIIYIRQQRRGLSASRNAALAQVSYPIVAVTDDDCLPDMGWIATIEKTFASSDGLAAVTGRVLPLSPEGDKWFPVALRTSPLRIEFGYKSPPWIVGSGNNFAVKREWFAKIGGCDERLGVGSPGKAGEDMDLFYRLLRSRARIRYEPESIVYHERQNKAGRIARGWMYGHGMGACCALWLRQHDPYALRILGHWLGFRTWLLAAALWRRQWMSAHEELLFLAGSMRGLIYGWCLRDPG